VPVVTTAVVSGLCCCFVVIGCSHTYGLCVPAYFVGPLYAILIRYRGSLQETFELCDFLGCAETSPNL